MTANPTRLSEELHDRFAKIDGFAAFMETVGLLSMLSSTPGWQDPTGKPTQPGAKPIGLKQWGDALLVAGLITEAVAGARWPHPAIDTEDAGIIMLSWMPASNAQLDLTLRSSLVRARYEWTTIISGMRSEPWYTSNDPREVIESLRAVVRSCQDAA